MQLTVPQRTIADAESFPVDPNGVNRWLSKLDPTRSTSDAMEVYRGLRHSNRLHNDLGRRRAVIACFIPTLRELNSALLEICQAQPLPLTVEFQRSAQLLDGLLREEAFAFKILLADSPQPRSDDIRRAMQALARQAESRIYGYKRLPETLLRDANQLYQLAEEFQLLDTVPDEDQRSTADHYKYIQLLSVSDCAQHRVRQLEPLLQFLSDNAPAIRIRQQAPTDQSVHNHVAIHLAHGARPLRATAMLTTGHKDTRWFNLAPILARIDARLAKSKSDQGVILGSESIDRQSFARLRVTLAASRSRRLQRSIRHELHAVYLGHKAICAHLHLNAAKAAAIAAELDDINLADSYEAMARASDVIHSEDQFDWMLVNESSQGAALINAVCEPGSAQVGELVSIESIESSGDANASGKSDALIGVVRWIKAGEGTQVKLGVEYLAKGVLPVGISRTHTDDIVADDALIIACKVKNAVLQTILLPAYLYQVGDRMTVTLNGKSRNVKLNKSLQQNGLFSHFSLVDV